ncbi:hypothetical protein [Desulforhopalus singaporensis]|uniref:Uncharacterized protein n=1 Tax=Desulforhopalus singaporensis TaxID=91360 RepID=A0A1H0UVK0_9BACT|nr:hypothetical protein [Desulforhopalus singaporensis]SDP69898.1 hypothetical protein SAMN05660330_03732 [Desulforhopalus singaporensis]
MNDALKNIFNPDRKVTIFGTVKQRLSGSRYIVEDVLGNIVPAQSSDYYPTGASVRVEDGVIVGRGALNGEHRVYEV